MKVDREEYQSITEQSVAAMAITDSFDDANGIVNTMRQLIQLDDSVMDAAPNSIWLMALLHEQMQEMLFHRRMTKLAFWTLGIGVAVMALLGWVL